MTEKNGIPLNINNNCLIKLTDEGKALLIDYYRKSGDYSISKALNLINQIYPDWNTPDNWIEFQIWELLAIFGGKGSIGGGIISPFETNIIIEMDK